MAPHTPAREPSGFFFASEATSPKRALALSHSRGMKPGPSAVEPSWPMTVKAGLTMRSKDMGMHLLVRKQPPSGVKGGDAT